MTAHSLIRAAIRDAESAQQTAIGGRARVSETQSLEVARAELDECRRLTTNALHRLHQLSALMGFPREDVV